MILWAGVIVLGLVLFFFWLQNFQKQLENFQPEELKKEFNFPELEMPEIKIPDIEAPELSPEQLKELEELMREAQQK